MYVTLCVCFKRSPYNKPLINLDGQLGHYGKISDLGLLCTVLALQAWLGPWCQDLGLILFRLTRVFTTFPYFTLFLRY